MGKLNQVIAIEKGVKSRTQSAVTELYKVVQKPDLFNGFSKTYAKIADDGEDFPAEKNRVQFRVDDILLKTQRLMTELFEVTSRKDYTNCVASADIVIEGQLLVKKAPVSFLLFLEKQLTDVRTMINALPLLDEANSWKSDPNSGLMVTDPISTHKTKKVQKPIVLYDATTEHPAQTQLIVEDVVVGYWSAVKQSGALAKPIKDALLTRVDTLLKGIKIAREAANMQEEEPVPAVGDAIFGYLLAPINASK